MFRARDTRRDLVDEFVHRIQRVVVDPADDLVEAVVDRAVAGGLLVPCGEAVDDGGVTAAAELSVEDVGGLGAVEAGV